MAPFFDRAGKVPVGSLGLPDWSGTKGTQGRAWALPRGCAGSDTNASPRHQRTLPNALPVLVYGPCRKQL